MVTLICTVIVLFVGLRMAFSYSAKRAQQRYAENKVKAPSVVSFRHLSKVLFLASMFITLSSYHLQYPSFLQFHDNDSLRLGGALLVLFGYVGLFYSFKELDSNYSPLFDAYRPFKLIETGIYAHIRHPIYTFNLCVSFGLALSSGILLVVLMAVIGLVFIVRAVAMEEAFLKDEFQEYASYCDRTFRFIPHVV